MLEGVLGMDMVDAEGRGEWDHWQWNRVDVDKTMVISDVGCQYAYIPVW
jgi:hypothetical protein